MPRKITLPQRGRTHWKEEWDAHIAKCRQKPDEVGVVLEDRPVSRAKSVNLRENPPFVEPDGRLRAFVRNSRRTPEGTRCDVYLMWETQQS